MSRKSRLNASFAMLDVAGLVFEGASDMDDDISTFSMEPLGGC